MPYENQGGARRPTEPDFETISTIVRVGSVYTVETIGGRELPEGAEVEESVFNEDGEFPLGQDSIHGLYYWQTTLFIHHPEVTHARQALGRTINWRRPAALATHEQYIAELRNPFAIYGAERAEDIAHINLRDRLPESSE